MGKTKSKYTKEVVLAYSGNYQKGREGHKVSKITIHHMAGVMSGKQCAKIFQKKGRYASANYCIGVKGDIVCNVYEENRAYTSSSKWNDLRAITIEVSNDKVGGKWTVSKASYNSLIKLCTDICKRYGFKLNYNKKKTGSLTMHCYYASTACPRTISKEQVPRYRERSKC